MSTLKIDRIHHVAYRCRDAKETVEWYVKHLNMDFVLAIAEDQVPSTKAPDPYMHVFLDAGQGNVLAFFELPNAPEMGRDTNTPDWVQHIAFKIGSLEMPLGQLRELGEGSVLTLPEGDAQRVELMVNGRCIGRGELVAIGDGLGVRLTRFASPSGC